jgi:undecaprenyl-diphosphatase
LPTPERWHVRIDLITILVGGLVLIGSAVIATRELTDAEVALFRAANDLPQSLNPLIWPLMQYGTFVTIPLLALIALVFRQPRLALALLIAGVSVYGLARLIKIYVERGRPGWLLTSVNSRETFAPDSLGFPSGHAAVAAALTVVVAANLPRLWAIVTLLVAMTVMFGRMYVGAHLPLDLVGGAALGAIAGALANLLIPPRAPSRERAFGPMVDEKSQP